MSEFFLNMVKEASPKVNHEVMSGLASIYVDKAPQWLDSIFRSTRSFPEGLEYIDYEHCSPQTEFCEVTRPRNNRRTYDLALSDITMYSYKFAFKGTPIKPRHLYLPYTRRPGVTYLSDTMYLYTPVLSDKVLSPNPDAIFTRLLKTKIFFRSVFHSIVVDGVRETLRVVYSNIYQNEKKKQSVTATTKAYSTAAHYLFAKYGLSRTFQTYAGFVPVVGLDDINPVNYPPSQWVITESRLEKPIQSYVGNVYIPDQIRLAIPKDKWELSTTKGLVAGFYYVLDNFPGHIKISANYYDNPNVWGIALGHILFSGNLPLTIIAAQIYDHFQSLDDYLDEITAGKLKELGHVVKNFYDLLALIIDKYSILIVDSDRESLTMFGKNLEVLYYLLYPITSQLFNLTFTLMKMSRRRQLTVRDIEEQFARSLTPSRIHHLTRKGSILIEPVSYSGDHAFPKIVSKLNQQENAIGGSRTKKARTRLGPQHHADPSMLVCGAMLGISKSFPAPPGRVNPYAPIDIATGTFYKKPEHEADLLFIENKIRSGSLKSE